MNASASLRARFRRVLAAAFVAVPLAVVAVAGLSASAAGTTAAKGGYWIVLGSDRDGDTRAYSVRPDGSRLTPLLPRTRALEPSAVSRDGGTIAYDDPYGGGISVSRADGTGLRLLARDGGSPALSRDGKRLAFTFGEPERVAVIGTDGSGRRTLTSGHEENELFEEFDWSPDGNALVFTHYFGDAESAIIVQQLGGSPRTIVRDAGAAVPVWSPDGRWIAYEITEESKQNGLYLVQPNGARRHRIVRGQIWSHAWSPDGSRLAVTIGFPNDVALVGADGRGLKRLHLHGPQAMWDLMWSPDGRLLAFDEYRGSSREDVWVVGADGRGLRRLTSGGKNRLGGWTRLAPVRPQAAPLLPSERVLTPSTVATRRPVTHLSADGPRIAFVVDSTGVDCAHAVVWTPTTRALTRFGRPVPCPDTGTVRYTIYDLALAGARVAWADIEGCGNFCDVALKSVTLTRTRPSVVSDANGGGGAGGGELPDFHLHGHGDLLVFNDGSRLVRIGAGSEKCGESVCATLRRGAHAGPVESVSGGLVAVREPDAVAVLDAQGTLVRIFQFGRDEVSAARLDGNSLVVARGGVIEVYDVATGAGELQRPLPSGYELTDVDGGIAVLRRADTVLLLRLGDGQSLTLTPGRGPVLAELEPPGLYYSYATGDGDGRVVFVPRSELLRQLG